MMAMDGIGVWKIETIRIICAGLLPFDVAPSNLLQLSSNKAQSAKLYYIYEGMTVYMLLPKWRGVCTACKWMCSRP